MTVKRSSLFVIFYSDIEFEFNTQPSDVTAVAGHETSLICRPPTSFPAANVTWYKGGALLQSSASARLFPAEVTSSGSLRFVNVQLDDDGQYVCVATNDFASRARRASAPATLTVLGKTDNSSLHINVSSLNFVVAENTLVNRSSGSDQSQIV